MTYGIKKLEPMYTTTEVAVHLNVTRRTVYDWIKSGRLNPIKAGPKLWQISETELNRFKSGAPTVGVRPDGAPTVGVRPDGAPTVGARPDGAPTVGARPDGAPTVGARPDGVPTVGVRPGFRTMPINPKKNKGRR